VTCRLEDVGWIDMGGGGFSGEDGYAFAYSLDYGVVAGLAVRAPGRRSAVVAFIDGRGSAPVRADGRAFVTRWYAGRASVASPALVELL
jgi:hypothetical protein